MKKIILSVAAFMIAGIAFAQKKAADVATFSSETINLGKIKQGNPTTAKFIVTNIGAEPLIIEQANPTCGCTISDYTKSPIDKNKTGYISATYNAAGVGHFEKHLTVKFAGVDELKSITIVGDVVAADQVTDISGAVPAAAKPAVSAVTPVSAKAAPKKSKKIRKAPVAPKK